MRYKSLIISILAMMLFSLSSVDAFAQKDGFFNDWSNVDTQGDAGLEAPPMPNHGQDNDYPAMPLGSGLLILGGLGLGYAAIKKRKSLKKGAMIALAVLSLPAMSQTLEYDGWKVHQGDCSNPMIGYAVVRIDGDIQQVAQYELGAFIGNECRGKGYCNNVGGGNYMAELSIYGSVGETFTFRVYDHNNKWEIFADCDKDDELEFDNTLWFASPIDPKIIDITTINYIFKGGDNGDINSYVLSNETKPIKLPLRNCKVVYEKSTEFNGGNVEYKDVVVNSGQSLTIGAGSGLAANHTVTNNNGENGLVIEASAPQGAKGDYWDEKFSSVGSLVSLSAGVAGTMETYFDNSASLPIVPDWHLISSPVEEQVIYNGLAVDGFAPGKEDDFYLWDEATATWCNIKTDGFSTGNRFYTINGSFNFVPGRGYLASYKTAGVKQYKGVFNQGTINVPLTKTDVVAEGENRYAGFNLVGNPYPSFLDWEDTTGWNRSKIYGFNTKENGSHCVMWIYNEDEGNYSIYVQGGGGISTLHGTRYIAPGQSFFVKATQAGNLQMRNSARTNEHTESGFMKNGVADMCPAADDKILKIRVENEKFGADEVVLALSEEEMNVEKLFSMSEASPELYFNENEGNYSIIICENVMACGQCGREASLPLNFKAKQMGKYTIKLNSEINGFDFVELEDSFTGEKTNLLTEEYSFYATGNDNVNRFKLNFGSNQNLDINSESNFVFQNGSDLIVKGKGNLKVVDVLGRIIFEKELTGDENVISCDNINKGVYIFKLEDKTEKIIIR